MDSYNYLLQHRDAIETTWVTSLPVDVVGLISAHESAGVFGSLLDDFIQSLHPQAAATFTMVDWAAVYQISPAACCQIISALRGALSSQLPSSALAVVRSSTDPIIDNAIIQMLKERESVPQLALSQRIQQMEDVARDLASATEEAERALVQLQSLYDISRQLGTSLSISDIIQQAIGRLVNVSYAHSGILWMADGDSLHPKATAGLKPEEISAAVSTLAENSTAVQRAFEEGVVVTIILSEAPSEADALLMRALNASFLLAVPLIEQEKCISVMTLHGKDQRLMTDLDLAQAVLQQTANAMRNGRLYEEVQRLNSTLEERIDARTQELVAEKERLETIYQVTTHLTTTLDIPLLTQHALHLLAEASGAQDGMILLTEDSFSTDLFCEASLHSKAQRQPADGIFAAVGKDVIRHRQGLLFKDFSTDARWLAAFDATRAIVAAPLMADRDLSGVLILAHSSPGHFETDHLRLVESVAAQLAATINNVNLHDYVREQVVRLGEMLHTQEVEMGQKQAILSSISDGVIASDYSGKIILVNPAAEQILLRDSRTLIGLPVTEIFEDIEKPSRQKLLSTLSELQQQGIKSGATPETPREIVLETDGKVINARLSAAFTSKEAIGVVTVLRDITKEVEASLAKSQFISTVSHELRTPMTSVKGYTDLLRQEAVGPLTPQQSHFLNVIHRNADRLTTLINDLLDVSRVESGKVKLNLQETQVITLVKQVIETLEVPAQEKGLSLTLDAPEELPLAKVDRDRITQVLTNLIGNSIAYTEQGAIHISARGVAGSTLQISVQDTGVGISQEDLPHIFDSFYRADRNDDVVRAHSGTGLGLTIVKTFVEMHSGRIWVESEVGKGSTFTFILPTAQQPSAAA